MRPFDVVKFQPDQAPINAREVDEVKLAVDRADARFGTIATTGTDRGMSANLVEGPVAQTRIVSQRLEGVTQ